MSSKVKTARSGGNDIFWLAFLRPFVAAGDQAFCKFVNWFTGFGKTHTAATFAVELFIKHGVYPIFLAPLQSLVSGFQAHLKRNIAGAGFEEDLTEAIHKRAPGVPVYRFYSNNYHMNDTQFFVEAKMLFTWVLAHQDVFSQMEDDYKRYKNSATIKSLRAVIADAHNKADQCATSNFLTVSRFTDDYQAQKKLYEERASAVITIARRIVAKAIRMTIQSRHEKAVALPYLDPTFVKQHNIVYDMMCKLFPLQAFLEKPGIIISTASKFSVEQQFIYYSAAEKECRKRKYADVFQFVYEINQPGNLVAQILKAETGRLRAVTFVDEEEDSYHYLFDQHKSKINNEGKNDLNWVINDWIKFFDISWPRHFEKGTNRTLATNLYRYMTVITEAAPALWSKLDDERVATNCSDVPKQRRIALFREALDHADNRVSKLFTDRDLWEILVQLIEEHESDRGFMRFQQKAAVLAALREMISASSIPNSSESDYSAYRRVLALIEGKKYFEMSRVSFGEWQDQPSQTFFDGATHMMDTEIYKRTVLSSHTGNQTIKLKYYETGNLPKNAFTLDHYLQIIILIAEIIRQPKIKMSDEDQQDYYTHLAKFRREIRKLFKARNMAPITTDVEDEDDDLGAEPEPVDMTLPVTDKFIYDSLKSIVSLEESRHQAEEYNKEKNVSLTVTITNLRDTPEEDLRLLLSNNNGIYLLSATGGLESASSGAFNIFWLKKCLDAIGGHLYKMDAEELTAVQERAAEWMDKRDRRVTIFNQNMPGRQFPTSPGYSGLEIIFLSVMIGKLRSGTGYNIHKEHEISGMLCTLDRIMSTGLRSAMGLCINVQWMRRCLIALCEKLSFIKQVDHSGNIFSVNPSKLPQYASYPNQEEIRIVIYEADRFRKINPTQTGIAPQEDDLGEFSKELQDALDITQHRLILWSAYGSASRGVNFITIDHDRKKDFELIALVNAPYYTNHTNPSARGMVIEVFQSMVQRKRDDNGMPLTDTRNDLLYDYSRNRRKILAKEHVIEITRTLFQSLGRVEREPDALIPLQEIYIHTDVAKYIYLTTKYAPELIERASPSQSAVLTKIHIESVRSSMFTADSDRKLHEIDSLIKAKMFTDYTKSLPLQFRTSGQARCTWEAIFDRKMFSNPAAYRQKLRKYKIPEEIASSLYLKVPATALLYTVLAEKADQKHMIITDYKDGTDLYDWTVLLGEPSLLRRLPEYRKVLEFAHGFPDKDEPGLIWVPQPWFARDIMRGYLAECVFADFVHDHFGIRMDKGASQYLSFINPIGHPNEAEIYQLYDFYLEPRPGMLVAIDIKNWSRIADQLLKKKLQVEARRKHERLRSIFKGKRIHTVYINLTGAHKYIVEDPPGGTIKFMSLYVNGGAAPGMEWLPNLNLIGALQGE